ncbi:MAG TPA: hypothetical protein VGL99_24240 [Chloroflexota bacterium]|jgi:hypothetical protein
MGFFASWWERVPVKQVNSALALVVIVSVVGVQLSNVPRSSIAARVLLVDKPTGEVWG